MRYGIRLDEFYCGKWGTVMFHQWLNPNEKGQTFTERGIDWLAQFIKPGDTVVDVGGYIGDTAIPMAAAAGKEGSVHVFEPNPEALEVLLYNSTINQNFAPIIVYPYAIGVKKEDAIFRYHAEQINGGALTEGIPVPVKRVRLDECDIPGRVTFVKFDCEGEDGILLAEFNKWLKIRRVVVQVERFPNLTKPQEEQLWKAITDYGTAFMEGDWHYAKITSLPDVLCNLILFPYA